MNDNNTEVTTTPQPAALRGNKKKAARDHFIEALAKLNRYAEPHFDLGLLPRTDLPDAEWAETMRRVMLAVPAALAGKFIESEQLPEVTAPEIQVDSHRHWQRQRSGYFQWNEYELKKVLEYLQQHPGYELFSDYAHSCTIKDPSGKTFRYHRDGRIE